MTDNPSSSPNSAAIEISVPAPQGVTPTDLSLQPMPPNVRLIADSYAEKWPVANQRYSMIEFGPISESYYLYLPLPLELVRRSPAEQWEWLRNKNHSFESQGVLATWGSLYARERGALSARLRAALIERVNDSVVSGLIQAPRRDPATGQTLVPAAPSLAR